MICHARGWNMKKCFLIIVPLFFLLIAKRCDCNAQNYGAFIMNQVDSLDNISIQSYKEDKPQGKRLVLKVKDQKQFDEINSLISQGIDAGYKNIIIKLGKGVYTFTENHIRRKNEMHSDVSITIEGNQSVITSNQNSVVSDVSCGWLDVVQLDKTIEVVDANQKICRVPLLIKENRNVSEITMIQIPQWYKAPTYKVTKIDRTGVYFIVPELKYEDSYERKGYNVNMDYLYKGKYPRYRLFDKSKSCNFIASKFIDIENCEYRNLTLKGIGFSGNKEGNELISISNVKTNQILIKDCYFENIKGTVGYFASTNNISINRNKIKKTDGDEFVFMRGCMKTRVTDNNFEDCGKGLRNTVCVKCVECDYYIANNTFVNFGYGAIGVGVWEGVTKNLYSGGIIEHNEAYYTPEYFANGWQHNLMDSGVIYTWTQNDDVLIRYNYIHNYNGAADNRGIFCDDGASNIKIYGNIVINTSNSYCIASRQVKDKRPDYQNNSYNFMAYNIIDGAVCFMGYGLEERHCRKGANFILDNGQNNVIRNKISDLEIEAPDIRIKGNLRGNQVVMSKKVTKQVKSTIKDKFINAQIIYQ